MNNKNAGPTGGYGSVWISDEALGFGAYENDIRRVSSRIHLSLFLYLIITYAVVLSVTLALGIFLPADKYGELAGDGAFNIILSIVSQYLIGFPLFAVILRLFSKPEKPTCEKIKFSELALLTLIAEALMLFGSFIGNYMSHIIGLLLGFTPSNSLDEMLEGTPIWLIILSVVILAPIVEEIIFRKMIIDRLSRFGGAFSVIISSVAFALIHANIYQFPYAFAVGLLLGYVYYRSGDIRYTIAIHMIMNFLGSVAILPVQAAAEKLEEMSGVITAGGDVNTAEYVLSQLIVSVYSVIQLAILVGGVAALIVYARKKRSEIRDALIPYPSKSFRAAYINVGAILFIVLCLILTVLSLF